MRLLRPRRRLRRHECRAVIEATALLCATAELNWELTAGGPAASVSVLSEELLRCRREGRTFPLPEASRRWLDLRYADPDVGYALAIVLLWSYGAVQPRSGMDLVRDDYVTVAMWELRHLLPRSAHPALETIEAAFRRAAPVMVSVGRAPAPGG